MVWLLLLVCFLVLLGEWVLWSVCILSFCNGCRGGQQVFGAQQYCCLGRGVVAALECMPPVLTQHCYCFIRVWVSSGGMCSRGMC